ncbi:DUF3502 domain-containing protein [Lachnoclostridium sp. Marseille-P6806]|uniref:DUF3502 domain-containing protein n=1 Tax=Lachnoclostridium sp. Marseille-P6806 TaxID=2364793 RepID=UPI001030B706|nr:DUF3502 domain-containing protein [Lachnoclostridium sp. Marseille-P6806]
MKKVLAAFLITTMAASLAACGGQGGRTAPDGSGTETDAAVDGGAAASGDEAAAIDTSEHVVINYMVTGDPPEGEAKENLNRMMEELNGILTEKVNAELQIYYIPWTDWLANYNLTLAQMDGSVDLVGTASDWLDAWPNAKDGAFLELSENMLKTYAPKTWASVSPEHWELCKYNGEIYLMPEDNYAQWTNHGFIYRADWAKEAGLDEVKSWEDMTAYFAYVRKAYPDIMAWDSDGTAYGTLAGGWTASHSDFVAIDGITANALWGGTKSDPYTITVPQYDDTDMMVAFAKEMAKWDEMGVWSTDVLNKTTTANRDDYRIGKVAAEQHHTQTWTDLCSHTDNNKIYTDDSDAESGFFWFGEETGNVVRLSITHGAMAVSAASENPERALMVYDLIRNDPDCYRLFNYGIKGVSWDVNEDGLRITPEGYNPDTQNINGMTNYWWGRNDDLEIRDASRNWDVIEPMYEELDAAAIDYPYGQFVPDVDAIQAQINNVNEVYTNDMKLIAYGKFDDQGMTAEEAVQKLHDDLQKAGIETVTEELQRQFDELYK